MSDIVALVFRHRYSSDEGGDDDDDADRNDISSSCHLFICFRVFDRSLSIRSSVNKSVADEAPLKPPLPWSEYISEKKIEEKNS